MRIHFMDMRTGEVYAEASAVKVRNGQLMPDSMGLPVIERRPDIDYYDCDHQCDENQCVQCWYDG